MTFTGTLIEDLMATVERVERQARSGEALLSAAAAGEAPAAESSLIEPWLASMRENRDYDSKLVRVA